MSKNLLVTPEGTKDYLFEEAMVRKNVAHRLSGLFESRGFYEVVTPSLEFLDVFNVKGHGIPIEDMFKLCDQKGRLMVMRPDSTMPIARLAATRLKGSTLPLRLYYNQAVYSTTRCMSGRSDEIMQSGVELIGHSSLKADLEVISIAINSLMKCKQDTFRIELGHIGIFNTVINRLNIQNEQSELIRTLIESKNYPALGDLLDSLGDSNDIKIIKQLPRLFGGREVFERAQALINDSETAEILDYLEKLYDNVVELGLSDRITVDLGTVNRTDYYTGVVFKGYIEGYGEAVLSGGRYDGLISQFGEDIGAIGFAVNVDAVSRAVQGMKLATVMPAKVLVFSENGYELAGLQHVAKLSESCVCEHSLHENVDEALEYARKRGISQVDIVSNTIIPKKGVC